ncbi:MAG: hypothetical protein ACOCRX_12030 [Candidatus Woesearchaeota archaeon]
MKKKQKEDLLRLLTKCQECSNELQDSLIELLEDEQFKKYKNELEDISFFSDLLPRWSDFSDVKHIVNYIADMCDDGNE